MARALAVFALVGCVLVGFALGERVSKTFDPANFGFTKGDDNAVFTTYVDRDASGKPTVVGFSWPDFVSGRLGLPPHPAVAMLEMPEVRDVPYKTFEFDWNNGGHPGGLSLEDRVIYDSLTPGEEQALFLVQHGAWMVPHFDMHAYHVDMSYISGIQPCSSFPPCVFDPAMMGKTMNYPAARFFPPNFKPSLYAAVPMMGIHWDDVTADVTPESYATTPAIIYGSWDGRMIFTEAMPAKSNLEAIRSSASKMQVGSLMRPSHFQRSGYYASNYRIYYSAETNNFYYELFDFDYFEVDDEYADDEWYEKFNKWQVQFKAWKANAGSCNTPPPGMP